MKISMENIRRIIKEELAASEKSGGQDKGQQQKGPKVNATTAAAEKASKNNPYIKRSTEMAAEKGGTTLVQNIMTHVNGYLKGGAEKKTVVGALQKVIQNLNQLKD